MEEVVQARTDPVSRHVSLPQGAEAYGGLRRLMGDVGRLLAACLDVDINSLLLMIAHVFCTWFPEKLPFAPYLAFVGPPSSGKTTALRILSLLCRRGLATSDLTSAAFYDVCHRMHPTILIDETATAGDQRTMLHLLRSSSTQGFVALRKGQAQLAYGAKVLSWVELPNDAAFNSRCIIIPMRRSTRVDLKGPNDPEFCSLRQDCAGACCNSDSSTTIPSRRRKPPLAANSLLAHSTYTRAQSRLGGRRGVLQGVGSLDYRPAPISAIVAYATPGIGRSGSLRVHP